MSDQPSGDSREAREWWLAREPMSRVFPPDIQHVEFTLDNLWKTMDEFAAHRSAADRQRIAELERDIEDFIAFRDHCHQLGMRWHNVPDGWRDWATLVNRRADSDESELEKRTALLREIQSYPNSVVSRFTADIRRALSGEERDSQEMKND